MTSLVKTCLSQMTVIIFFVHVLVKFTLLKLQVHLVLVSDGDSVMLCAIFDIIHLFCVLHNYCLAI